MRVSLTGDELAGIADRLTQRLERTVKATIRNHKDASALAPEPAALGQTFIRELARELAPIVCPEDAPLTADQARALMRIKKSKWHMLRRDGKIPAPESTICGDRWRRSTILRCMAHLEDTGDGT